MICTSKTGVGENNHNGRGFDFEIVPFGMPAGLGIVWLILFGIRTFLYGPSLGVLVLDIDVWLLPAGVMLLLGSLALWIFFWEKAKAESGIVKGDLLYTTPKESRLGAALTILFTGFFWIMAIVALFSFLTYGFGQKGLMSGSGAIFLVFISLYMPFVGPFVFLEDRFDIHTRGVTRQTDHMLIYRREGKFIHHFRMKAFEVSSKGTRCAIYLDPEGKAHYKYNREVPISHLRYHLKKAGIEEISSSCSDCKKYMFGAGATCPECSAMRFT